MQLLAGTWRPLPEPSWLSQPFWDGCSRGELLVQRCSECDRCFFRPEAACPHCFSQTWAWTTSSGAGVIHSFSVVWRPAFPEIDVPYVVAVIEMDEHWYLMSNIIDCDHEDVRIDVPVVVSFVEHDGFHFPFFTPVGREPRT